MYYTVYTGNLYLLKTSLRSSKVQVHYLSEALLITSTSSLVGSMFCIDVIPIHLVLIRSPRIRARKSAGEQ